MQALAAVAERPDLTTHWVGITSIAIFVIAYVLVISEELTHLNKSKPVVVVAGLMWMLVAWVGASLGMSDQVQAAIEHVILEYSLLLLFLFVAMTYVNALEDRNVFDALRSWLLRSGFGYRKLFWLTGIIAFVMSPVADNLTTALVMCSVAIALGADQPRFVVLACINIVVAANAGGAFSPFGDITTLMVWQKGLVTTPELLALFVPALVNFLIPAAFMHFSVPNLVPPPNDTVVKMKIGARRIVLLFVATMVTTVLVHSVLHLPSAVGMMMGLGYLQLLAYFMQRRDSRRNVENQYLFNVFQKMAAVEWDTLLFFYGVMMCVGALGFLGYLHVASHFMYGSLGPSVTNISIGVISAILDNIPLMYAVLTMEPNMSHGQWLLVTLTAGVGGSLLSVGSAAGVAVMGRARGIYTFASHLRWTPAIAVGYAASILVHMWLNQNLF